MVCLAFIFGLFSSSIIDDIAASSTSEKQAGKKAEETFPPANSSLRIPAKGARVYLIGDFLYWTANQEGLNFSYKAKGQPEQLPLTDVKIEEFDEAWNTGFRVGLGYRLPHDSWEARAYVTQFRTTNHLKESAKAGSFIQPNFGQSIDGIQSFLHEMGTWHLKYTLFDIELSKSCAVSKALAISPFFGARAAWIQQTTRIKFSDPIAGDQSLHLEGKNKYTAGGLRLGTDLNFYLAKYISFFGQASLNLLSGHFDVETEIEQPSTPQDNDLFSGKRKPNRLCANCELRGGAKGTIPLYRKQAFLTLGLTYDMSLWFSQNQLLNFFSTPDALQVQPKEGNLTLQGITLCTRLDF